MNIFLVKKTIYPSLISCIITYFILNLSPQFFGTIQPDSYSYINGHSSRPFNYHFLIKLFNNNYEFLIVFQKILLSTSLVSLCFFLYLKKINTILIILFYLTLLGNYYYTSYSKILLTESIFFSVFNFAIVLYFNLRNKYYIILFGICCGLISIIKPIGLLITSIFFIFSFFQLNKFGKVLPILIIILSIIFLENLGFYSNHEKKQTVLPNSIIGKLFILSGKKNFNLEKYPPEYKKILESSKKDFLPVHNFLSKINNPFLKAELSADYEVLAQYQAFELENLKLHKGIKEKIFSDHKVLVKYMLKNNFLDYLKLSFFHYLGNWSIGSKILYLEKIEEEPPHYDKLSKVSGEINLPKDFLLIFVQLFFYFLFVVMLVYTLINILNIFKKKIIIEDLLYIFILQAYLLSISLINVSTPRYLMLVYPLLLIICLRLYHLCDLPKFFRKFN